MPEGAEGQAAMSKFHEQHLQAYQTLRTAAHQLEKALPDAQAQRAKEILPGLARGSYGMMGMMMDM
jgi:hypothetical protein